MSAPLSAGGWCVFERHMASLVKDEYCFLSWRGEDSLLQLEGDKSWENVRDLCRAGRLAPLSPDEFEAKMRQGVEREKAEPGSGIRFTSGKDLFDIVIPQ